MCYKSSAESWCQCEYRQNAWLRWHSIEIQFVGIIVLKQGQNGNRTDTLSKVSLSVCDAIFSSFLYLHCAIVFDLEHYQCFTLWRSFTLYLCFLHLLSSSPSFGDFVKCSLAVGSNRKRFTQILFDFMNVNCFRVHRFLLDSDHSPQMVLFLWIIRCACVWHFQRIKKIVFRWANGKCTSYACFHWIDRISNDTFTFILFNIQAHIIMKWHKWRKKNT